MAAGESGLIFFRGKVDSVDRFTDRMIATAEKKGIPCLCLDANEDPGLLAQRIIRFREDRGADIAAILFNNIYLMILEQGQVIWDRLEIPVYDILLDHPVNYDRFLADPIGQLHIVVIDRAHETFIREVFPRVKCAGFLPLGGIEQSTGKPYAQREIDVLYVGQGHPERPYLPVPFLPDRGVAFYESVVNELLHDPFITTEEAVRHFVSKEALSLSREEMLTLYNNAVISGEWNVRRIFKQQIMKALGAAGIKVTIYGGNWEDSIDPENIRLAGSVTANECRVLAGNARICLNVMPWFKDGAHDRIFDAMLNGSVCVTDTSRYLLERFEHGRELVFFELNNIPQLVENVRWLLDNPEQAESIARRGTMTAVLYDTWEKRMETLLSMIARDPGSEAERL